MHPDPLVFNMDTGGAGDNILHFWHGMGYKSLGIDCRFWANTHTFQELRSLFQMPAASELPKRHLITGGSAPHYLHELRVDKGKNPRAIVWGSQLPHNPPPIRPAVLLTDRQLMEIKPSIDSFARGRPVVLLYPIANWGPRRWPMAYWRDLAAHLEGRGYATAAIVPKGLENEISTFPFRFWGQSWTFNACLMRWASLVIANDSGPAHLSGTLGTPTIALMGPTKNVFSHMPEVLEIGSSVVNCTGCHFEHAKGFRAACDLQCRSLMTLFPEVVADRAMEVLTSGNRKGTAAA